MNDEPKSAHDVEYEEFKAEINDNVLCVRVPKNAGIVRRVYDSNKKEDHSASVESVTIDQPSSSQTIYKWSFCLGLFRPSEANSNYSRK